MLCLLKKLDRSDYIAMAAIIAVTSIMLFVIVAGVMSAKGNISDKEKMEQMQKNEEFLDRVTGQIADRHDER